MGDLRIGVIAASQQCHFTPDYVRNYTVIGTEGRLENFGDRPGDTVRVWNTGPTGRPYDVPPLEPGLAAYVDGGQA
ncbi:MAG TPA: hypothetical protein VFV66_21935 [Nonomuraea sp.]|nr:hypothetical protein [Nonomuraea sp.]